jgi:flagellar basal-body rod protein FlgC
MNLFGVMNVSASALGAERLRAEVTASNMANIETTKTDNGGPYRRKQVVFAEQSAFSPASELAPSAQGGVRVRSTVEDRSDPILRFEPGHPDADENGFVAYPNINPVMEMTDMLGAVRAYEMNVAAVNASKQMIQQSLDILR